MLILTGASFLLLFANVFLALVVMFLATDNFLLLFFIIGTTFFGSPELLIPNFSIYFWATAKHFHFFYQIFVYFNNFF